MFTEQSFQNGTFRKSHKKRGGCLFRTEKSLTIFEGTKKMFDKFLLLEGINKNIIIFLNTMKYILEFFRLYSEFFET